MLIYINILITWVESIYTSHYVFVRIRRAFSGIRCLHPILLEFSFPVRNVGQNMIIYLTIFLISHPDFLTPDVPLNVSEILKHQTLFYLLINLSLPQ